MSGLRHLFLNEVRAPLVRQRGLLHLVALHGRSKRSIFFDAFK